jgi:selenocysteine lyase/cysteine desulfurase
VSAPTIGLRLRAVTPAVLHGESRGWAYFDGPSGTQMIGAAIEATAHFASTGLSNRHGYSPAGDETENVVATARRELRAFFVAEDYDVVFGQNMTSLAFALGHAVARGWHRDSGSLVITELEHAANVYPWTLPLAERGVGTLTVTVDPESLELDLASLERVDSAAGVPVVATTAAANAVGVKPDLHQLRDFARAHDALFVVDGVHATPHDPSDLSELQPDVYLCSGYKFYGPHVGVALVRKAVAEALRPYKVAPAPESGGEKFETGSQNHEGVAALAATLCGLGRLVGRANGSGAREAVQALGAVETDHARLLVEELRGLPGVHIVGHGDKDMRFVATVALTVDGLAPVEVAQALRARGVFVTCGDFWATHLAQRLGVKGSGGWVRVGLAGYTTLEEVRRLVAAFDEVIGNP